MSAELDKANELCLKIYGQSYHEVFGFDSIDVDEIKQNIVVLQKKNEFVSVTIKETNVTKNNNFLDIWRLYWNSVVIKQPILCDLYGLCAISQLLKHVTVIKSGGKEDDIRIHLCTIMPSGTGKSEANDALAIFAKQLNLRYGIVDKYNDASLVGSINRQAIDSNIKHGKNPGDEGYINPDEKGILRKSDFVVFDEGENILKTTPSTEGAQRYLQKAMNRYMSEGNYIANTLVGHATGGYPDCSVVITSYYLEEFQETLLDRGLLQRMIVYIQNENYDTRTSIIDSILDGIPTFDEDPEEAEPYIRDLKTNRLRCIQDIRDEGRRLADFHKETTTVSIKADAKKIIGEGIYELRNLMPFLMGQKQVWESMVTRMTINLLKVAAVHALINYRMYIDVDDAKFASKLMISTMTSMAFFLRENVSTASDKKTINLHANLRKKYVGEKFTSAEWVDICIKNFNLPKEKANMLIRTMIENGKMEETVHMGKKSFIIK